MKNLAVAREMVKSMAVEAQVMLVTRMIITMVMVMMVDVPIVVVVMMLIIIMVTMIYKTFIKSYKIYVAELIDSAHVVQAFSELILH